METELLVLVLWSVFAFFLASTLILVLVARTLVSFSWTVVQQPDLQDQHPAQYRISGEFDRYAFSTNIPASVISPQTVLDPEFDRLLQEPILTVHLYEAQSNSHSKVIL